MNTAHHRPFFTPKAGIKSMAYKAAPQPSTTKVPFRTLIRKVRSLEFELRLKASRRSILSDIENFLLVRTISIAAIVIIPRPPICTRIRINNCPIKLQ